jgi:hypothetical protein
VEGTLNKELGLGSGDEYMTVHVQGKPPEIPFTEEVGERGVLAAGLYERAVAAGTV